MKKNQKRSAARFTLNNYHYGTNVTGLLKQAWFGHISTVKLKFPLMSLQNYFTKTMLKQYWITSIFTTFSRVIVET